MVSITDVYESTSKPQQNPMARFAGGAATLIGILFVVSSIVFATSNVFHGFGLNRWQTWEVAGVVGGVGASLIPTGICFFLPVDRRVRLKSVAGSVGMLLATWWFFNAFPNHWQGDPTNHSLFVVSLYFIGFLYAGIQAVTVVQIRNAPGGTVNLNREHITHLPINESSESSSTQNTSPSMSSGGGAGISTNNLDDMDAESDDGEILSDDNPSISTGNTDPYCGNCDHFEYSEKYGKRVPVCLLYDEEMDDLDACEDWTPRDSQKP